MSTPMSQQATDRTRLAAHYVIARAQPDRLGATKLNKVLWFADLASYRRTGRTITGQWSYEKRQFGPVPNGIFRELQRLETEGVIVTRRTPTPTGERKEFIWLARPQVSVFSAEEIDILNEAIGWVCDMHTAASISDATHDALWDEIEVGDQIPIGAASITPEPVTSDDIEWAREALAAAE